MRVLTDLIQTHLDTRRDAILLRALPTHEGDPVVAMTYGEMHERASALAAMLQGTSEPGARVLIVNMDSAEFVVSLFGCWYAGMIAVPIYPPSAVRRDAALARMVAVIEDCEAAALLTNARDREDLCSRVDTGGMAVLEVDRLDAGASYEPPRLEAGEPALIQYTSGSTGEPKGVVLSHRAILSNLELINELGRVSEGECVVNWMPLFHDLGLSIFLCAPFAGGSAVILTPEGFLRRPARWLEALSTYGGVLSGAPNFAFELCCARVKPEELEGLDLSRWRVGINAAEPVKASTIERFHAMLSPRGLAPEAVVPSYGLAEATAYGTAGSTQGLVTALLDPEALQRDEVVFVDASRPHRRLVGCGRAHLGSRALVVDPESGRQVPDAHVGEIWLSGPQLGSGYWGRPELSEQVFGAILEDDGSRCLRTGDLGFFEGGELFVTGRSKDLVIVHGRNHYPQDLEASVEACHPAFRAGCSAAFTMEREEELVVVAEIRRVDASEYEAIAQAARVAIAREHGLALHRIVLIPARHIHKTSSGKIKRRACMASVCAGEFDALFDRKWDASSESSQPVRRSGRAGAKELERLVAIFAERLDVPAASLDVRAPFVDLGIDSATLVELVVRVQTAFGRRVEVAELFEHPTLDALARHLAGEAEARPREVAAAPDTGRVAIVGAGCRLPGGVTDLGSLWEFVSSGEDAIEPIPESRWSGGAPGHGAFLPDVDLFDAEFFGISAGEARAMDPQQRLLLEVVWEAIESAGWTLDELRESRTGVFVGISSSDYAERGIRSGDPERLDAFSGTATATSVAAGRISYVFGLQGPALSIDTACSSSLVALHAASQSIEAGDCDMAIVAGVNLILSPAGHTYLSAIGALAADGHCKTFDARADGYVRAEGCAAVVLRREPAARQRGERVLGVMLGSSVNHDGRSNGLTAPNAAAQRACYTQALERAAIAPDLVDYVEAHGTGTALGDPIEVAGLASVYGEGRAQARPLRLGAIKAQLGHGEAAAGLTGLLKVLAMFRHGWIPAQANLAELNPRLDWSSMPVEVPREAVSWSGPARHAAVSSFGISGTNAHVILAAAPEGHVEPAKTREFETTHVLPVSARSRAALAERVRGVAARLADSGVPLDDLLHTAGLRRSHMNYRAAVSASSRDGLLERLGALELERVGEAGAPGVVFVFSGHGSQWFGMGRALAGFDVCREVWRQCELAFAPYVDWSLTERLMAEAQDDAWGKVDCVQPMIFAMEVALAALWRSWGVEPDVIIGHSMGEIAAFLHAGALSLEDAARIICTRSRLMRRIEGAGEMLVIGVPREQAEEWIAPWSSELSIGVHNSPNAVVLSGSPEAIAHMHEHAKAHDLFARHVKIDVASHSPQTEVLRDDMLSELAAVAPRAAHTPVFSTVLGDWVEDTSACGAGYWFRNLRDSVRFMPSIATIAGERESVFVELSPHPILTTAVKRILAHGGLPGVCVPSMRRDRPGHEVMGEAAAELFRRGVALDWSALAPDGAITELPRYPFQRERHWLEPTAPAAPAAPPRPAGTHPLLGEVSRSSFAPDRLTWPVSVSLADDPWFAGHEVRGRVMLPASCYLEIALAGAHEAFGARPGVLERVEFLSPIIVREHPSRGLQLDLEVLEDGFARFQLATRSESGAWTIHARGWVGAESGVRAGAARAISWDASREFDSDACYAHLEHYSLRYSGRFRGVERAWVGAAKARAKVAVPSLGEAWGLDPASLDACFHVLGLAQLAQDEGKGISIPKRIGRLVVFDTLPDEVFVEAEAHGDQGDVSVRDAQGREILRVEGLAGHVIATTDAAPPAPWEHQGAVAPAMRVRWNTHEPGAAPADPTAWVVVGEAPSCWSAEQVARVEPTDLDWSDRLDTAISSGATRHVLVRPEFDGEDPVDASKRALAILSRVVRAAARASSPLRLWVMTTRATHLPGVDVAPPTPPQAAIWGACNAIELEHPKLACTRVDVDAEVDPGLVSRVLGDARTESRTALRATSSYVARLERAPDLELVPGFPVDAAGTHLVTGGFGALGSKVVEALVDAGAPRVVVASRSGASSPERRAWIESLRGSGARVESVSLDVSDAGAVADVLASIASEGPALRGVFHTAGVLDDRMFESVSTESLDAVFAGKVEGAIHLSAALEGHTQLEHFVSFSSAASVIGSPGQGAYAAANAFLDALSERARSRGVPATSVRFGPVHGAGLAHEDENASRLAARGVATIERDDVVPILSALLRDPSSNLVPLRLDLELLQRFYPSMTSSPFFASLSGAPASAVSRDDAFVARLAGLAKSVRVRSMERFLQEQIAGLLEASVGSVSKTRSVQELGFDSLLTLELLNQLELVLGVELPATFVWRHPSVAALAPPLLEMLGLDARDPEPAASPALDDVAQVDVVEIDPGFAELSGEALLVLLQQELEGE